MQSHLKERAFYYQQGWSIDVGLLSETHHKISLIAMRTFYQMKVLSPFGDHFLLATPCWAYKSTISHCDCSKLVFFQKCSCILLTPPLWLGKVVLFYSWCSIWLIDFNNDLLDVPLHSPIDGLRIKNRCHQKDGDISRPQYLIGLDPIHTCECC